jgi:hypothetical protein
MTKRATCLLSAAAAAALSGCTIDASPDAVATSADEVVLGPRGLWVSPSGDDARDGRTPARAMHTLQAAVDALGPRGGTIRLLAGEYPEPVNIVGVRHLDVVAARHGEAILRPTATLGWNVSSYGETRRTPVRVVDSTDVTFRGVTFDFEAVHGDLVAGVLVWNSTGSFERGAFRNMATEGFSEFTAYVSAPAFTADRRARVSFEGNDFVRTGRVGVIFQTWSHGAVTGNTFRAGGDFGYAVEVSSQSTADLRGNDISGYRVIAPDESASAGILVENAFTVGLAHADKEVVVRANHLHDNAYGLAVGNAAPGLAGDVDIALRLEANLIDDNDLAGVSVTDEGRAAGSSVRVAARGNLLSGNHASGYLVATAGDGDVGLDVMGDVITDHEEGVSVLEDTGASLHAVSLRRSLIRRNSAWGVHNLGPSVVDARDNWWGSADGPADGAGTTEVTHRSCADTPLGERLNAVAETSRRLGDRASERVDYCGWVRLGF